MTRARNDSIPPTPMPTPFERVAAQRADARELIEYRIEDRDREIQLIRWDTGQPERFLTWYLGRELSRTADKLRQVAVCDSDYVGTMLCVLEIRPGEPVRGLGEGFCELGTILSWDAWYIHGARIEALTKAGVELSWNAAQWLHAAGRAQLAERRQREEVPGDLEPGEIRLNLFHRPTPQDPAGYTRDLDDDDAIPPLFAFEPSSGEATDLASFARAIASLTRHPDPRIDRLLRDPLSRDVLRDLLLERGGPVEMLLADAAELELDWLSLPEDDPSSGVDIDGDLSRLWNKVLELDPMIDTSDDAIFELPAPWIESIHGPRER